ncbi:MAG: CdaR family protein [Anaerolineae bacterium]
MRRLLNELGSILLALILAVIVWVVAMNEENPITRGTWGEPIPIELVNQPAGTVIVGDVPKTVQVEMRAPQSSWRDLRRESFRAVVDLAGAQIGMNQFEVHVECSDPRVEILESRPSTISVRLERLKQASWRVQVVVMDSPPFGYEMKGDEISTDPGSVTVTGPETFVNQVSEVIAEVYLRGATETVERRVSLRARDAQGEAVNVTLEPATVVVKVPIVQQRGFRNLPVRVVWKGQPAAGYRINNVSVDPSIVTIIGDPQTIEQLPGYLETAPVQVEGATADVVERVSLILPENVSLLGVQTVQVTISVTPIESSLTVERRVQVQGLPVTMQASVSPETISIILSGPLPKLDALRTEDVQVIIDVFALGPGMHQLAPIVIVPEGIRVQSVVPERVQVGIIALPTPTPTATSTPTPAAGTPGTRTVTPTPTPAVPTPTPRPANATDLSAWHERLLKEG